ncbi:MULTISPECIES: VOC family protein [Limnochorda]|uniref:VOC family protein n=1 Tax=Limnochorda TaxID=1676651 RepID=UPI00178DFE01|nr:VOC family protein [Limnochorda pilosa]MBO2486418.1 hypothetical protein [Bacillota bacterium]MBO2518606.1 hypothetical protein [Bacillota bacterium]NMA70324.1 VOC family protein [Bacillota bacterium]
MFRRIDTVFVRVRNLDEAVAWYTQHLGLEVRWRHPGVACLNLGETPLTLLEAGEAFHPVEEAPFNFYAPDIEAAYARLRAAGVPVDEQITDDGGVRWFGFRDPDGNRLEVCWWPEEA